jgi:serine/threonine-protein kinase RsbW
MRQAAAEVPIYERMLPAVPVTVGRIRRELDDALACLDVAPRRREDIALVVTEAATNAVLHAYVDTPPGPLYVTALVSGRSLLVTVCDWGRGMLPHPDSPGAGFGVSLMRTLTNAVEIRPSHADRGTRVALLFHHAIPAIGAPAVSHDVQGAMTADDDVHALRVYLSALAETTAAICDDTQALHAEARHAVARARRLCAQPLNAS